MGFLELLEDVAKGAVAGVAVVAALPVCGAIGTVTACGAAVGATVGVGAVILDAVMEEDDD